MLLFFYHVFLLAYEEVKLYSPISVDRQPFKQSVNHFQHLATLFKLGQDSHHLHLDVWRETYTQIHYQKTDFKGWSSIQTHSHQVCDCVKDACHYTDVM